jgi:hypothetical protein
LDFTLTTPGLFEVQKIQELAQELGVDVLAKVVFSFSPDIIMSPLALPRDILHPWVDEILAGLLASQQTAPLRDILVQLKTRPTFAEQWPDTYQAGLRKGKARILELEKIRKDVYTFRDIMSLKPQALEWYDSIS